LWSLFEGIQLGHFQRLSQKPDVLGKIQVRSRYLLKVNQKWLSLVRGKNMLGCVITISHKIKLIELQFHNNKKIEKPFIDFTTIPN
jgi:hypothetical protein